MIVLTDDGLTGINPVSLHQTVLLNSMEALNCIEDNDGLLWISSRDNG